jgi:hypothetical protein
MEPTGEVEQGAGARAAGREETKCEGGCGCGCGSASASRVLGVSCWSTEVDTTGTIGTVGTRGSRRVFDAF